MSGDRDRVALVTGAASGIGRGLVEVLAARGARVVVTDRDAAGAETVAAAINATGGRAWASALDVTDAEAFSAVVERVVEREGRIDLLINNAGVGLAGEVRDMSLADWGLVLDVNVRGVVHGIAAAYPRMIEQGGGQIVNVASGAGLLPRPGMTAYAASKHAIVGLSTSLRAEAAPLGVRVNVACPGHVGTNILNSTRFVGCDGDAIRDQVARLPLAALSPTACAERILRGAAKDRAVITVNTLTKVEWLLFRWLPALGRTLALWRGRQLATHRLALPSAA